MEFYFPSLPHLADSAKLGLGNVAAPIPEWNCFHSEDVQLDFLREGPLKPRNTDNHRIKLHLKAV